MLYLGLFLLIYGILILYLTVTKSAFIFKNFKVKAILSRLGEKGTYILLLVLSIACILAGIILIP